MKKALMGITVAALVLAGCGAEQDSGSAGDALPSATYAEAPETVETTTAESTTAPAPAKSPRGHILKEYGEKAWMENPSGELIYSIVLHEVVQDYKCASEYAPPSSNGQYIAVKVTVETGPALHDIGVSPLGLPLMPDDWQIVSADGVLESGTDGGWGCVPPNEDWPDNVSPNVTVNATFVVDTKNTSGFLIFNPWFGQGTGWEWTF